MIQRALHRLISWPGVLFLANFGISKGLAFLGPIWLGLVLTPDTYGLIEFALAISGFVVVFAMCGIPQAAIQLIVMRQDRPVVDLLAFAATLLGGLAIALALSLGWIGQPQKWVFVCAILSLSAAQQGASTYARSYGLRNLTAWADHMHMVLLVLTTFVLLLVARPVYANHLQYALIAIGACLTGASLITFLRNRAPQLGARLRDAVQIGTPMLASSECMIWIIASGRIYIEHYLSVADLFAYSFSFRVAGLLLLLHAIVGTAFSARLYRMPSRRFDRFAMLMVLAIGGASLLFILIEPQLLIAALAAPENAPLLTQRPAVALVPAQIFFWGAGSIIEMRLSRVRRAGSMVVRSLGILCLTGLSVVVLTHMRWLNFTNLLSLLVAQQALLCIGIHEVLIRRKVPLRKTALATLGAGAAVLLLAGAKVYWAEV